MNNKHHMHLEQISINKVLIKQKDIEVRLLDEKRSRIHVGDTILFSERDGDREIEMKVKDLIKFKSFQELYQSEERSRFGKEKDATISELVSSMRSIYSEDDELSYGVVGIVVEVV